MNPFKQMRDWFIGDYLSKTEDVFEKAKIELTYNYSLFFFSTGLLFYGNLIANELWYHFYIITFACISLGTILFVLKYSQNRELAANWYVIQQIITSTVSVFIQEFKPDMSSGLWTISFILYVVFVFGVKRAIIRIIPFVLIFIPVIIIAAINKTIDLGIPDSQQLPNQAFVTIVPFSLCVYLVFVFVNTNSKAEKQIQDQKFSLAKNNAELEVQRRDSLASINYARRIQYAVLPNEETIYRNIPLSFIIYKPKDIVSGDFYWFHEIDKDNYIIACGDCTGHGVPGALMTVIGNNLLNQTIIENKITEPSKILTELDRLITITLKQQKEHEYYVQDGMDIALMKVNKAKKEIVFSGAKRLAIYIHNKTLEEIKGNKYSLGGMSDIVKIFEETNINYTEDDIIYLFTDGCTDQFGGEKGKKFSIKQLRELLISIHTKKPGDQKQLLENALENWKGNHEQVDDILLIGIKF